MTPAERTVRHTRVDETEAMLRTRVAEHRQVGDHRLPPEKELSQQLGVSRATLRAALSRLESDGEIVRRRRAGTLITSSAQRWEQRSWLAYPVDVILSLPDYLRAVGVEYRVRAVGIRRESPSAEIAATLGLPLDGQVFVASRLFEVQGEPAAFVEHLLPVTLDGHEVHIESLTEGVTTFLRDTEHIQLNHAESTFTAEGASPDIARELKVAEGAPLLVMHARLYSKGSFPVALGRLVFRPDVLCLTVSTSDTPASSASGVGVVSLLSPQGKVTVAHDEQRSEEK